MNWRIWGAALLAEKEINGDLIYDGIHTYSEQPPSLLDLHQQFEHQAIDDLLFHGINVYKTYSLAYSDTELSTDKYLLDTLDFGWLYDENDILALAIKLLKAIKDN